MHGYPTFVWFLSYPVSNSSYVPTTPILKYMASLSLSFFLLPPSPPVSMSACLSPCVYAHTYIYVCNLLYSIIVAHMW